MTAKLTILVPNYNRPAALGRLLSSLFGAIAASAAAERVEILVVDDFSQDNPAPVIAPYMERPNFRFRRQVAKCGNAELAFLSALEWVETDYVWLFGNDDEIFDDGVATVLHVLDDDPDLAFILLNPSVRKESVGREDVPIRAVADALRYEKTEDLFMGFGFCTSTTTFPCLIMKAEPVRAFHRRHKLTDYATVYAHTFTIFGALRERPAIFLARPLVRFTLNERHDEQRKLLLQSPNGVMFHHQTVGLARLVREGARAAGIAVARLGRAIEDEVNKDTLAVHSTYLPHFLVMFVFEQLACEQLDLMSPQKGFGHLSRADLSELGDVVEAFGDRELFTLLFATLEMLNGRVVSAQWRLEDIRRAQKAVRLLVEERRPAAVHESVRGMPDRITLPAIVSKAPAEAAHSILLTILLPVYNGETYIGNLLALFADAYPAMKEAFARVEIVVANNASTDRTQAIAESFAGTLPMLRPLDLLPHMPTVEENIFRSFAQCRGEFIWALGVDDIPNFAIFAELIALLGRGEADFYLFNFAHVSDRMLLASTAMFNLTHALHYINIVDLTQRFGYWGALAGISGQIMRTSLVADYDFANLIEQTGKIYAHVTAYLECFHAARSCVVNLPLVFYKLTPPSAASIAHWGKYARLVGVFDEYFWTAGYIKHLNYLEGKGVIGPDYLRFMVETAEQGFFRPVFVIADKLANQIRIMSVSQEARNHLTATQFDEVALYLARKEPFLREFIWRLAALHKMLLEGRPVMPADWEALESYKAPFNDYLLAPLFQCADGDYEIYRVANRFFGVYRTYRPALLERLRYLEYETLAPEVFAGDTIQIVREKIAAGGGVPMRPIARMAEHVDPRLSQLTREIEVIRNSASWRVTRPLRAIMSILRQLRRRR